MDNQVNNIPPGVVWPAFGSIIAGPMGLNLLRESLLIGPEVPRHNPEGTAVLNGISPDDVDEV